MAAAELKQRLGQLFVIGFPGATIPSPVRSFLAEERIGGIILFADNCATHQTARQIIAEVRVALPQHPPFVAIDQEGGRVCRLRGAPAEYRAAEAYGKEDIGHFAEEYRRAALFLESLGFNLNLAPVADIMLQPDNSVLAGRCFGSSPEQVARFVTESVTIARSSGLLSCLKHCPGLGDAANDPHHLTAVSKYDRYLWEQREAVPFRAGIEAGADLVMTTHLLLPAFDTTIVTGSAKIVDDLIRTELAFDGPIITDDLLMKGASPLGDIGERTIKAFLAGHDLLLFGQDYEAAFRAYDQFVDAYRRGEIDHRRVRSALARVEGLKYKLGRSVLQ